MATTNRVITGDQSTLPKRAPAWTLYVFTAFAVLTVVALVYGLLQAGVAR